MSEQTIEQQAPSKEEVIAFLKEQIEVKKVQLELQSLNADLADAKARELRALQFVAQITNPRPPEDAIPHNLSQEDLDENPELAEQGFKVGDEVLIPKEAIVGMEEVKKQRTLKKV